MEIWKEVKGYEGIYEVSNLGRVKRILKVKNLNVRYRDNYFLKPLDNGCGYYRIKLSKEGKSKRYMLHRIISEAFIDNPNNYSIVNHINGNKKDNSIDNLEWCTQRHNVIHFNENNPLKGCKVRKTKGYVYDKRCNLYYSRIGINCKTYHLGTFKTKEEAIEAYNIAYDKKVEDILKKYNERLGIYN